MSCDTGTNKNMSLKYEKYAKYGEYRTIPDCSIGMSAP
jgi:hypothetical protein